MGLKPQVTILIPTYSRAKLLARAIKSAQSQTYSNIVICVYDNASIDNTHDVVQLLSKFDRRIKYIRHEKNIGAIENYNYALNNVQTPFFSFLADDDILLNNCIYDALHGLLAYPEVGIWGGNTLHADAKDGRIIRGTYWAWRKQSVYSSDEACKRIAHGYHIELQGLVIRTKVIKDVNFDFSKSIKLLDIDIQLILAKKGKVGFTNKVFAIMFSHKDSVSSGIKDLSTYWPSLSLIGDKFLNTDVQYEYNYSLHRAIWNVTSILHLLVLAGRTYSHSKNELRLDILHILKSKYFDYFIARIGSNLLMLYGKSKVTNYIAWNIIKLLCVFYRPQTLFNRIFPFGC